MVKDLPFNLGCIFLFAFSMLSAQPMEDLRYEGNGMHDDFSVIRLRYQHVSFKEHFLKGDN